MKSIFFNFLAAVILILLYPSMGSARFVDQYFSFQHLSRFEKEGVDFKIRKVIRNSDVSIFAIHGGKIEPQTSEVAELLAGSDLNYYSFEGIKKTIKDNGILHITSSRFDEPQAMDLAISSRICISLHSYFENNRDEVCVGGANSLLKKSFLSKVVSGKLPILFKDCIRFPGKSNKNIINRCNEKGVQLELSTALCKKIEKNRLLKFRLVNVMREQLDQFLLSPKPKSTK